MPSSFSSRVISELAHSPASTTPTEAPPVQAVEAARTEAVAPLLHHYQNLNIPPSVRTDLEVVLYDEAPKLFEEKAAVLRELSKRIGNPTQTGVNPTLIDFIRHRVGTMLGAAELTTFLIEADPAPYKINLTGERIEQLIDNAQRTPDINMMRLNGTDASSATIDRSVAALNYIFTLSPQPGLATAAREKMKLIKTAITKYAENPGSIPSNGDIIKLATGQEIDAMSALESLLEYTGSKVDLNAAPSSLISSIPMPTAYVRPAASELPTRIMTPTAPFPALGAEAAQQPPGQVKTLEEEWDDIARTQTRPLIDRRRI